MEELNRPRPETPGAVCVFAPWTWPWFKRPLLRYALLASFGLFVYLELPVAIVVSQHYGLISPSLRHAVDLLLMPLDDSNYPGHPIRFRRLYGFQLDALRMTTIPGQLNWRERCELRVLREHYKEVGQFSLATSIDNLLK